METKIVKLVAMRTEHNEEYVVGLGEDNRMYEWDWTSGNWVRYQKA